FHGTMDTFQRGNWDTVLLPPLLLLPHSVVVVVPSRDTTGTSQMDSKGTDPVGTPPRSSHYLPSHDNMDSFLMDNRDTPLPPVEF
ncbi:hypothetical protein PENTCL1PPCAC_11252, partial [Pristionchus entomophagus]